MCDLKLKNKNLGISLLVLEIVYLTCSIIVTIAAVIESINKYQSTTIPTLDWANHLLYPSVGVQIALAVLSTLYHWNNKTMYSKLMLIFNLMPVTLAIIFPIINIVLLVKSLPSMGDRTVSLNMEIQENTKKSFTISSWLLLVLLTIFLVIYFVPATKGSIINSSSFVWNTLMPWMVCVFVYLLIMHILYICFAAKAYDFKNKDVTKWIVFDLITFSMFWSDKYTTNITEKQTN